MAKGDYYVDPNMVATGQCGGSLPDGHPRRCQGTSKRTRKQCGKVALTGKDYCEFHGGRQGYTKPLRKTKMSKVYSRRLTGTLKQKLEDVQKMDEVTSLEEEVGLARVMCLQAVDAFNLLHDESKTTEIDKAELSALQGRAEQQLRNSLNHVRDMVSTMARVKTLVGATIDPQNIHLFAEQIVRILHDQLKDKVDDETIEEITDAINDAKIVDAGGSGIVLSIEA